MAKRRRAGKVRTITRYVKGKFKRRSKSSSQIKMFQPDALVYGAVRGYMSNALSGITNKIPLGGISDEVGIGILNYFIAKNTSGMIKNIATKGLIIENAMLGAGIVSGGLNIGALTSGSSVSSFGY